MKPIGMWSGAFALLLTACASNPQQLPVDVSNCRANHGALHSFVVAQIHSKANRPIARLAMTVTFYRDFRYQSFGSYARLPQELDPGDRRDVTFDVLDGASQVQGPAMRCFVTRIDYLDGTWEAVPRNP